MPKHWFRVQSIGTILREDQPPPDQFLDPAAPSVLRIDDRWAAGLEGIDEFSHLVVLSWLDRAERRRTAGEPMHPDGREDIAPVGFFSTRTPKRPNPIGIATPSLQRRVGNDLHVTGIDAWDGTPIIDIKGYYPRDEMRPDAQVPVWLTDLWRRHDEERTGSTSAATDRLVATPKGEVLLREPHLGDVSSALRFINAVSAEESWIMFQGEQMDEEAERGWILDRMRARQQGTGVTLTAVHDGEVIGNSQIDLDPLASRHMAELGIAVALDWRGIGLGRALMTALIDEAVAALPGLRIIRLNVFEGNEQAITLYRSLGFVETGRIPGAILRRGEYIDLIQMAKPLEIGE
jgi:tRNA (adenine37-N6)-methyltransferase